MQGHSDVREVFSEKWSHLRPRQAAQINVVPHVVERGKLSPSSANTATSSLPPQSPGYVKGNCRTKSPLYFPFSAPTRNPVTGSSPGSAVIRRLIKFRGFPQNPVSDDHRNF